MRENPSPIPPPSEDTDSEPSSEHSEVISLPSSLRSPTSPDLTIPRSLSPDRTISPIPTMGTVKDLAEALTEKLKDIGRHPTIPLTQFSGKKGEDPNDHCMKVEDYFAMFDIKSDEDQKRRFLETLFEKARRWASTINIDELDGYKYDDKSTKEQKERSFKWQFLKRFTKERRTTHAAFEAWRNLKFDPVKDEVEEFMTNVKYLAATLEFNEEAQIMAIKSNMPRDVYGLCMQYNKLEELKKFLIELFENPRMKSAVPSIPAAAETSAFSMGEFVNNDVVSATSEDIGKLKNEISTLQYKVRRMTSADTRSKPNSKPWKPEVTLPRRRGGNFRGKGGRQNDAGRQTSNSCGTNGNSSNGRNQSRNSNSNNRPFGNRGQNNGNFGGNQRNIGRNRGRFDTSPNVTRAASKMIDKDNGRCFYCNEFRHFIRECPKKIEDKKSRRFSRMDTDYNQDGQYLRLL